jgi:hypothetical protein
VPLVSFLVKLKRVAIFQIRLSRSRFLFSHVVIAKPLHSFARYALARKFEAHFTEALGIIAPVLTHLDEQEEMDWLFKDFRQLAARRR